MPSVFFVAFKVRHFYSFFGGHHGRVDIELVPKFVLLFLQYDECSPSWFCFRLLQPMWPAHISCIYRRTMAFSNHVEVFHRLVSTSPYALDDNKDASRVISLRFSRGMNCFFCLFVVVGLSLPLSILPFAPVAYQVILEPGIGQFVSSNPRERECILVYKFVGTFSCAQNDLRKEIVS